MFSALSSLGTGIGANLLPDGLAKRISAFQDKEAVQRFIEGLYAWEIQFDRSMMVQSLSMAHLLAM